MACQVCLRLSRTALTNEPPTDISAAKFADILFVKEKTDGENDLAVYCQREHIKHVPFQDFSTALPIVQSIIQGKVTIADVVN